MTYGGSSPRAEGPKPREAPARPVTNFARALLFPVQPCHTRLYRMGPLVPYRSAPPLCQTVRRADLRQRDTGGSRAVPGSPGADRAAPGLAGSGRRYRHSMMAADAIAALIAGVIALEVRSGGQPRAASYVWFTFGLPVLWVACVALARGYEPRIIGTGTDEFRRVINAGIGLTVAIAIAFSLVTTGLSAGYVFIAMPLTLALDLAARCWLRRRLHRVQALGGSMRRAVAVGHARDVADVVRMLRRERDHGLSVVAACLAGPDVTAGMTNVAVRPRIRRAGRRHHGRPRGRRRYGGRAPLPRAERGAAAEIGLEPGEGRHLPVPRPRAARHRKPADQHPRGGRVAAAAR